MKAHMVSAAEKKMRINTVFDMIIEGKATTTIVKFCMSEWGVVQRTGYAYLTDADKILKNVLKVKKREKINRAVAQREFLIERLIDGGAYGAAIQGLADRDKLQGLYEQTDTDITVTIEVDQK